MPKKTDKKNSAKQTERHENIPGFEPFKITLVVSIIGGVTLVVFAIASYYL